VRHVTDIKEIGKYGVMGTPALIINGEVKSVGSVPPQKQTHRMAQESPRINSINSLKGGKKMEIKVLGPGCPKCEATEKNVKEAVAESGLDAQVDKVTDVMEIAKYGVFGTPAVVIDGEVKSVGKIPKKEEIKAWIRE
jgi:small redox-active disulfide protein 2